MQACILVGGLGTRLRSVLPDLPKPMAPIGTQPFLHHLIAHLHRWGITDVVLLTGYKHEVIERYFGHSYLGSTIAYSVEHTPLGTAGAVRNALDSIASDQLIVINGDTFFPCDLQLLMQFHAQKGAECTIGLKMLEDCSRYGTVEFSDDYRVTRFAEKDVCGGAGFINAGVYVFRTAFVARIPSDRPVSMETEVLPAALRGYALPLAAPFIDIGVPEDYARAPEVISGSSQDLRPALFVAVDAVLDRDSRVGAPMGNLAPSSGALDLLSAARNAGFALVLMPHGTHGAERAFAGKESEQLRSRIIDIMRQRGIPTADSLFVCPEFAESASYRTDTALTALPRPGQFLRAAEAWRLDLGRSLMIGTCDEDRIRLPYLRSYTAKVSGTEAGTYDFESVAAARRLFQPANTQ